MKIFSLTFSKYKTCLANSQKILILSREIIVLDFGDESTNPYDFDQTTTPTPPGGNCESYHQYNVIIIMTAIVIIGIVFVVNVIVIVILVIVFKRKGKGSTATLRHRKLSGPRTPSGHCFSLSCLPLFH